MIVYQHIVDYINKKRFPLHDIPDSYGMINEYFLENSELWGKSILTGVTA